MTALTREHIDKVLLSSLLLIVTVGCGQQSGCGEATDYPENGLLVKQGMQAHVTESGMDNLGGVVGGLITDSLGGTGGGLSFCVPRTELAGVATVCQNADGCAPTSMHPNAGCDLEVTIESIEVAPIDNGDGGPGANPADGVAATIGLTIDEQIPLQALSSCILNIRVNENEVLSGTANILLPIDSSDERMTVLYDGATLDAEALDLDVDPVNPLDWFICEGVIDTALPLFEGVLLDQVSGFIDPAIEGALGSFLCLPCDGGCPAGSTCNADNQCIDDATDACVETPLGLEMALDLGDLLGGFGSPDANPVALSIYPANYADASATTLSIGVETGATAEHNECVPFADPPAAAPVPRSTELEAATTPNGMMPFDIGIGISETFVEHALWSFYIGGGLCLEISGIQQLSTTTLGLILPSINDLTLGKAAPVFIKFQPKQPPTAAIGAGTIGDDGNGGFTLIEPLITLELHNLDIELYAYVFDRYTRIMTINADIDLPLGLTATPAGEIVPVLGDLENALSNVTIRDSELIGEDPETIANILPGLISGFLPSLAEGLSNPIALPELAGLQLEVKEASGIESNTMIGLFAGLSAANSGGLTVGTETIAQLRDMEMPMRGHLDERGAIDWSSHTGDASDLFPVVHLDVAANLPAAMSGDAEFSYRVDGGLWSVWVPGDSLRIDDATLFVPGRHTIEVRSQVKGQARTLDLTPAVIEVVVDWVPPRIDGVRVNADAHTALVRAVDETSAATELRYRHRAVGTAAWSSWSSSPVISLAGFDGVDELEVQVADGQNNVRAWIADVNLPALAPAAAPVASANGTVPPLDAQDDEGGCGCTTVRTQGDLPAAPLAGLALALGGLIVLRRRRQRLLGLAAVALLALALVGCDDDAGTNELVDNPCDDCGPNESCVDQMCVDTCSTCSADETCGDPDGDGVNECIGSAGCNAPDAARCPDCSTGVGVCLADGTCGCESLACDGGCGSDAFCCESTDTCTPNPAAECTETCEVGFESVVVTEGSVDQAACTVTDPVCECQELPEIPVGNFGLYTNAAATPEGNVVITAYNTNYGDLMFGVWDAATGETSWDAIDGIPVDGEIEGKPDGFRGGVRAKGPSVGTYSDVAVDAAGVVHVSFQSRDDEDLRYGRGEPDGSGAYTWSFHTVDTEGRTGFWTSISLDGNGAPGIAYMTAEIDDGGPASQVRFAQAASGTPAEADWTITTVHTAPLSACSNACQSGDFCRFDSGQCATPVDDTQCAAGCAANERCFGDGCAAVDTIPEGPRDWERGIGLHTAHARNAAGGVHIVFYDSLQGNGWLSRQAAPGEMFAAPALVAGADANGDTGNQGLWPSIAIDGDGNEHVAYVDFVAKDLVYWDVSADTRAVVDDGSRPGLRAFVGDDASVILDSNGAPTIAYQDATLHHLVLAAPDGNGGFVQTVLDGEARGSDYTGAYGFYADHVIVGTQAVAVNLVVNQQSSPLMRVEVRASNL